MDSDKYKLKRVDNIHGTIKATFVINNLTSEEFVETISSEEIQDRLNNNDTILSFRKEVYLKALDAINNYESSLLKTA